jgi:NitT/TauT family transport system ATP-binding protein
MPATGGQTLFEGDPITQVPDRLAVVFQDYSRSLFPWSSVASNVALPLRVARVPRAERARRVEEMLAAVGLAGTGRSYPWQLSGGMQQRVAIARALAHRPELLLMDEPFASVDAQTRFELEDMILQIRDEFGVTVVLVTHDIDEAVYLADRVVVLSRAPSTVARIVDIALPRPRRQTATRSDPAFGRLRTEILELVTGR